MSTWAEKVVWVEMTVRDPNDEYYEDYIGKSDQSTPYVDNLMKYGVEKKENSTRCPSKRVT